MRRSNKGFTLLEIIIVIIIVGILASVAMPKLFANIEFSQSAEALSNLGLIQRNVTTCSLMTGTIDWTQCGGWGDIGMEDPSIAGKWTYTLDDTGAANAGAGSYVIEAERDNASGDTITMTIATTDGNVTGVTKAGTGAFEKIK